MKRSFSFSDELASYRGEARPRRRHGVLFVLIGAAVLVAFSVVAENLFQISLGARQPTESMPPTQAETSVPHPLLVNSVAPAAQPHQRTSRTDPVVVSNCRLGVIYKQDVPCQREGVLLWVGTEVTENVPVEEDRLLELKIAGKARRIRMLKEGDVIQAGQLLAQMDDRLPRADLRIRKARWLAAQADFASAERVLEEAKMRQRAQERLARANATSSEESRAAILAVDRSRYEAVSKKQAVALAEAEYEQAATVLELYQVRSAMPGMIKTVYRQAGESIRALEPVVQVWSLARLRAEGQVDLQHLPRLQPGMEVTIEPTFADSPQQTLVGHLQKVTGVAVSKDTSNPQIVSTSEDGTVRLWDRATGQARGVWKHGGPIRAVACTPPGAADNLCLYGAADGKAWISNLNDTKASPRELQGGHQGAISCLAFSLDGKVAVTGGDDRAILLWEIDKGTVRYRFPQGHRGAVTSLHFTRGGQLVSAGRDHTLRLWDVGEQEACERAVFDRRAGDVTAIGTSPDGRTVLFDQGDSLSLLSLPGGQTVGILQQPSSATRFVGLALYSPDGRTILTTSSGDGGVQLWAPPSSQSRGHVICRLVSREEGETTCAAFDPRGAFFVTGTRNRQVLVWSVPALTKLNNRVAAKLTLVEQALDTSTRQVRVCAELANRDLQLLPGTTVTMTIYPR
jgi:WD40 repeat protein